MSRLPRQVPSFFLVKRYAPSYHAAWAAKLATDILVDLFAFFSPPALYERLFVLTAPDAVPSGRPY